MTDGMAAFRQCPETDERLGLGAYPSGSSHVQGAALVRFQSFREGERVFAAHAQVTYGFSIFV